MLKVEGLNPGVDIYFQSSDKNELLRKTLQTNSQTLVFGMIKVNVLGGLPSMCGGVEAYPCPFMHAPALEKGVFQRNPRN